MNPCLPRPVAALPTSAVIRAPIRRRSAVFHIGPVIASLMLGWHLSQAWLAAPSSPVRAWDQQCGNLGHDTKKELPFLTNAGQRRSRPPSCPPPPSQGAVCFTNNGFSGVLGAMTDVGRRFCLLGTTGRRRRPLTVRNKFLIGRELTMTCMP